MAMAVARGGIVLIEITWSSDRPTHLIETLRSNLPNCVIGAGTLLSKPQMKEAIAAGAQFLFSPHTERDLIHFAIDHDIPMIPGALSPTEIVSAWQAGAASVKVFPIQSVGGASYIKSLQGPLGQIPLIPTGGVTVDNAKEFLHAGAIAVGLSTELFPKWAIVNQDWQAIQQLAATLLSSL
jgi:2-dehydro-3-deoxyphosphogluconate aldolase / (4S)-4-hydroxy-2-oxoglutarate aldolase